MARLAAPVFFIVECYGVMPLRGVFYLDAKAIVILYIILLDLIYLKLKTVVLYIILCNFILPES